jgi:hypothetical protein
LSRSLSTALKAARQLGIPSLLYYARYQVGLHSGYYLWKSTYSRQDNPGHLYPVLELPARQALLATLGESAQILINEAIEIVQGRARLYGSEPEPLQLAPPGKLAHWTVYEKGKRSSGVEDIKDLWEPARFGWAFILGRAYILTGDERYAQSFWEHTLAFLDSNPAYLGPNWISGQEAALRLFAFVFSGQVFSPSPHSTIERKSCLVDAIAAHASRIPLTMVYAKAQNNNHLLTEAAGLYTAGLSLPDHPAAQRWRDLGWRVFNQALQTQITPQGVYIQHSTNYHRLMLQTLLWVISLSNNGVSSRSLPYRSRIRAAAATRWLMELLDKSSGRVPNLGPNDGAYILPFSTCPFDDFRPVLQAAASAFLGIQPFPTGPVDEMALWFRKGASPDEGQASIPTLDLHSKKDPYILRNNALGSWAYLRAAHFKSRPGHADQLHLDLWWRGENVAMDPGTFRYNARPPWDNPLARTEVHNTISVNNKDQMTRAGRFLWLDWAQARVLAYQLAEDGTLNSLTVQHDGYRRAGVHHRRKVSKQDYGWQVYDELLSSGNLKSNKTLTHARLHWLLPNWPWEMSGEGDDGHLTRSYTIQVKSTYGWIQLRVRIQQENSSQSLPISSNIQLVRAGELLYGSGDISPIWGWFSPTYSQKIPALSFSIILNCYPPASLTSDWSFPPVT